MSDLKVTDSQTINSGDAGANVAPVTRAKPQNVSPGSGKGVIITAIIYVALAVTFSQLLHFSRALDEGYHLEYITFIKQNNRLPISYEERAQITRADFPPLYHLLVSFLSAGVDLDESPRFKIFWDSFRYRAIDHQRDQVWALETEDLQWPYIGQFLVWQIGRWLSIALSLATVVIVFFTLRDIPPLSQYPWAPAIGAALLAFIPRYILLGSALNDDNLLGPLAAIYFWMLVRVVKNPERGWPFAVMGAALGLSMTVKYTLVLVPLEIIAVCALIAWQRGKGWGWALQKVGLVGGLALVFSSWWFGWNIWFLNTVSQDGWLAGILRPLLAGGTDTTLNRISGFVSGGNVGLTTLPEDTIVGTYPQWVQSTFFSFWGVNIEGAIPFFPEAYIAIGLVLAVTVFGLWRVWQSHTASRPWLVLLTGHLGLFLVLPWLRFELTRRLSVAAQGRHILVPAAAAVVALLVWGLAAAIPQRWRLPVFSVIIIGFASWTGAHLYKLTAVAAPPPLPLRSIPQAAGWLARPANAEFGEAIELVSYDIHPAPEQGVLHLNLAWRSLGYVNESYRLRVEMLNSNGNVVSHWVGYNGHGRLPTLAWDPGDSVFDRLVLPLPNAPAGAYSVRVQLLGREGPLQVIGDMQQPEEPGQSNALLLPPFSLDSPARLALPHQARLEGQNPAAVQFGLWRADGPASGDQQPLYRYPATIAVVTSHQGQESTLTMQLVDEAGQMWPAVQTEAGIYTFVIGPRWQSGQYHLQMALEKDGDVVAQTTTGPLLAVENWWERQFEVPGNIEQPLEANFANQIKLLGYKLPQKRVKAGDAFPVTFYWQAPPHRSPQANFIQFNHLLDGNGNLRGGYDRRPLEYYSTLLWAPGEVVVDGYTVPVDAGAPPGEYWLDVGYYITVGESAVNLPLVVGGEMTEISSVTVGPIEVVKQ